MLSPHRRKPLKRQEQPSLLQQKHDEVQEAPVLPCGERAKGCGAPVFAGPCNASLLQLTTFVFVSNLMKTKLKIT